MRTEESAGTEAGDRPARYKRILLKLSGESFGPAGGAGVDFDVVGHLAQQIAQVHGRGIDIAVVVGGGNILRGVEAERHGLDRPTADYMGMLGTVINGLALRSMLEQHGVVTRVMTAIWMQEVAEPFIRGRALRHLEKGRIVIFAAGTGSPYFTTDTPAALRALEIGAEAILMGKRVRGVFDADPVTNPEALFLPDLTYMQVLERGLKVMDATAITMCMDHGIPIHVFNLLESGNIERIVLGETIGTIVH